MRRKCADELHETVIVPRTWFSGRKGVRANRCAASWEVCVAIRVIPIRQTKWPAAGGSIAAKKRHRPGTSEQATADARQRDFAGGDHDDRNVLCGLCLCPGAAKK